MRSVISMCVAFVSRILWRVSKIGSAFGIPMYRCTNFVSPEPLKSTVMQSRNFGISATASGVSYPFDTKMFISPAFRAAIPMSRANSMKIVGWLYVYARPWQPCSRVIFTTSSGSTSIPSTFRR